jgi:hypothetical protein
MEDDLFLSVLINLCYKNKVFYFICQEGILKFEKFSPSILFDVKPTKEDAYRLQNEKRIA